MSQTQQEKQRIFREKLQAEGADGFADGPRPWEQWDESGNQGDDRIWEGTARRIYPKQKTNSSIGDRLLSGLAAVALATLLVGIAGVYLSTTSAPQLASSAIHPAPIVPDRPARHTESTPAETPANAPASLASLETLQPPAAGKSAPLQQHAVVLEPALQPAPAADPVDRVAVETVITPVAITTTVYTQQPDQDQPEQVASIETTPPPFTSETAEQPESVVLAAQDSEHSSTAEEPATMEAQDIEPPATVEESTADSAETVQADIVAAAPESAQQPATDTQLTATAETVTDTVQTEVPADKPAVVETPATIAMNSTSVTAEATPDISREIETATQTPVLPDTKTGKWVINLSSYTRKSTAEKMLAVFREKGVEAEVFTTTINDKPMHRIRVAGFQSSRRAKAEIPAIEQTLGLEGAWVSRR